jgi:cellobiose phosphorylase
MNYSKGIRENGGQYTHAVAWYLMALIKMGYHDRAYRYFQMINPATRTLNDKQVDEYRVEPYVIAADIYSSESFPARGGWTWYTGSAGWFYRVGVQDILGIHKQGDKLKLIPKMPIAWDKYNMDYRYMDTIYHIEVNKGSSDDIKLDGKSQTSDTINLSNDKKEHKIVVSIK